MKSNNYKRYNITYQNSKYSKKYLINYTGGDSSDDKNDEDQFVATRYPSNFTDYIVIISSAVGGYGLDYINNTYNNPLGNVITWLLDVNKVSGLSNAFVGFNFTTLLTITQDIIVSGLHLGLGAATIPAAAALFGSTLSPFIFGGLASFFTYYYSMMDKPDEFKKLLDILRSRYTSDNEKKQSLNNDGIYLLQSFKADDKNNKVNRNEFVTGVYIYLKNISGSDKTDTYIMLTYEQLRSIFIHQFLHDYSYQEILKLLTDLNDDIDLYHNKTKELFVEINKDHFVSEETSELGKNPKNPKKIVKAPLFIGYAVGWDSEKNIKKNYWKNDRQNLKTHKAYLKTDGFFYCYDGAYYNGWQGDNLNPLKMNKNNWCWAIDPVYQNESDNSNTQITHNSGDNTSQDSIKSIEGFYFIHQSDAVFHDLYLETYCEKGFVPNALKLFPNLINYGITLRYGRGKEWSECVKDTNQFPDVETDNESKRTDLCMERYNIVETYITKGTENYRYNSNPNSTYHNQIFSIFSVPENELHDFINSSGNFNFNGKEILKGEDSEVLELKYFIIKAITTFNPLYYNKFKKNFIIRLNKPTSTDTPQDEKIHLILSQYLDYIFKKSKSKDESNKNNNLYDLLNNLRDRKLTPENRNKAKEELSKIEDKHFRDYDTVYLDDNYDDSNKNTKKLRIYNKRDLLRFFRSQDAKRTILYSDDKEYDGYGFFFEIYFELPNNTLNDLIGNNFENKAIARFWAEIDIDEISIKSVHLQYIIMPKKKDKNDAELHKLLCNNFDRKETEDWCKYSARCDEHEPAFFIPNPGVSSRRMWCSYQNAQYYNAVSNLSHSIIDANNNTHKHIDYLKDGWFIIPLEMLNNVLSNILGTYGSFSDEQTLFTRIKGSGLLYNSFVYLDNLENKTFYSINDDYKLEPKEQDKIPDYENFKEKAGDVAPQESNKYEELTVDKVTINEVNYKLDRDKLNLFDAIKKSQLLQGSDKYNNLVSEVIEGIIREKNKLITLKKGNTLNTLTYEAIMIDHVTNLSNENFDNYIRTHNDWFNTAPVKDYIFTNYGIVIELYDKELNLIINDRLVNEFKQTPKDDYLIIRLHYYEIEKTGYYKVLNIEQFYDFHIQINKNNNNFYLSPFSEGDIKDDFLVNNDIYNFKKNKDQLIYIIKQLQNNEPGLVSHVRKLIEGYKLESHNSGSNKSYNLIGFYGDNNPVFLCSDGHLVYFKQIENSKDKYVEEHVKHFGNNTSEKLGNYTFNIPSNILTFTDVDHTISYNGNYDMTLAEFIKLFNSKKTSLDSHNFFTSSKQGFEFINGYSGMKSNHITVIFDLIYHQQQKNISKEENVRTPASGSGSDPKLFPIGMKDSKIIYFNEEANLVDSESNSYKITAKLDDKKGYKLDDVLNFVNI